MNVILRFLGISLLKRFKYTIDELIEISQTEVSKYDIKWVDRNNLPNLEDVIDYYWSLNLVDDASVFSDSTFKNEEIYSRIKSTTSLKDKVDFWTRDFKKLAAKSVEFWRENGCSHTIILHLKFSSGQILRLKTYSGMASREDTLLIKTFFTYSVSPEKSVYLKS